MFKTAATAIAAALGLAAAAPVVQAQTPGPDTVRNVVLVHGAFADGSGWRRVHDDLTARGYRVSIVQNPLTSFADDVAATRRVLAMQDGPSILVGHSYGGAVITEVGVDPSVAGLVYIAALAPDVGESTFDQFAEIPAPPTFQLDVRPDGFAYLKADTFIAGFAADAGEDAPFLRDSQVPIAVAALEAPVSAAAWKVRPSWYVVATEDGAIDPELLRQTARRIGAETTEVEGSHVVFLTRPGPVADVIDAAARGALAAAAR